MLEFKKELGKDIVKVINVKIAEVVGETWTCLES